VQVSRHNAPESVVNPFVTLPSASPIGLQVRLQRPFERVCCRGIAIIGSSNGPHAAALAYAGCGRFRGWMPHNAFTAITELVERFGRPDQPIDLKIPRFTRRRGGQHRAQRCQI